MEGYDSYSGFISEFRSRGDYKTPSGKTQEGENTNPGRPYYVKLELYEHIPRVRLASRFWDLLL